MNSLLNMKIPGTSKLQFLKLTGLGISQSCLWLPLTLTFFIINIAKSHFLPYQGWNVVHKHFNIVKLVDPNSIPSEELVLIELSRWMGPLTAVCLFLFFGTKEKIWADMIDTCKQTIDHIIIVMESYRCKLRTPKNSATKESSERSTDSISQRDIDLEKQETISNVVTGMSSDCEELSVSINSVFSIHESFNKNPSEKDDN